MKEPIEYLGNVNSLTTREELYNIGKQMQIDAIEEAVNLCAENARVKIGGYLTPLTEKEKRTIFKVKELLIPKS